MSQTKAQLIDNLVSPITGALGSASAPTFSFTADPNTGLYSPGADQVAISTNGTGRLFVDASGRVLVGTSSARANLYNSTYTAAVQVEGTSYNTAGMLLTCNINDDATCSVLNLAKSRGTTVGSNTLVSNGDTVGIISFSGNDGTEFVQTAVIISQVDGTPGANDMPGRLVFSTTADGASNPTERLRITSAGLVGVGTSSPGQLLEIRAAASGGAPATSGTTQNGLLRISQTSVGQSLDIGTNADSYSWLQATNRTDLSLKYPLAINPNGGNVGIGTTSPDRRLTVTNTATEPLVLLTNGGVSNDVTDRAQISLTYAGGTSYGQFIVSRHGVAPASNAIDFYTCNGTASNTVTSGSNHAMSINGTSVGIGTKSPGAELDVRAANGGSVVAGRSNSAGTNSEPGYFRVRGPNASGSEKTWMEIFPIVNDATNASEDATLVFRNIKGGYLTDSMRIDSSGRLLVGTSSTSGLQTGARHVFNDGSGSAFTGVSVGNPGGALNNTDLNITAWSGSGSNFFTSKLRQIGDGSLTFHTQASSSTDGAGTTTERLRIDSSGRVGIGTSAPTHQLQVSNTSGSVFAGLVSSISGVNDFYFGDTDNLYVGRLRYDHATDHMSVWTNGAERLRITSAGLVGIGTTSPSAPLHINGTANNTAITLSIAGTVTGYIGPAGFLGGSDSSLGYRAETGNNHAFFIGASEKVRIDSSGRLGIGTSSPSALLTVSSGEARLDLNATNASGRLWNLYAGGGGNVGSGSFAIAEGGATQRLVIVGGGSGEALRIDASNRVGIGTTSPSRLLTLYDAGTLTYLQLAHSGASGTSRGLELVLNSNEASIINREAGGLFLSTAGGPITFGSAGERARLTSDGKFLVGTTTGYAKFHVNTGTNQNFLVGGPQSIASGIAISAVNDTNGANVPLELRGSEIKINAQGGDSVNLATSDTTRLRVTSNGSQSSVVPGGSTLYPQFGCRAWVNFDGTGTVAIRDNGNVSSITDNGTGDYTINFGTAMPDANYSTVFGSALSFNQTNGDQGWANLRSNNGGTNPQQAGSVRIWASSKTSALGAAVDPMTINVAIFR